MAIPGTGQTRFAKWLIITAFTVMFLSCSDEKDPLPQPDDNNLVSATLKGSRSAAELKFFVEVSGMDIDPGWFEHDVDIYEVVYTTTYQSQSVEASGLVLLPMAGEPLPMVSFQRGTIVRQTDAPSLASLNSENIISASALASTGFITVLPDLLGFGNSDEIFHPYYVEDPTATAVIDLLRAAATLADEKEAEFNQRLFLAGYSQGGYATLATHKALEADPLENVDLIASFPGSGGYDIQALQEYFFTLNTYDDPYYLAYVGLAYQSYYGETDLVDEFFNEPYASRIPGLFDGISAAVDINGQLTTEIPALVKTEILSGDHPVNGFLQEKFAENSLIDWAPAAPVFLYHGDIDTTVPFENSQTTYEALIANGADPQKVTLTTLPGDHSTAVMPYVVDVIKKLYEMK